MRVLVSCRVLLLCVTVSREQNSKASSPVTFCNIFSKKSSKSKCVLYVRRHLRLLKRNAVCAKLMRQSGAPNFWETRTRSAPNLSPTKLQITNGYFVDKCNCAKKKSWLGWLLVVGLLVVGGLLVVVLVVAMVRTWVVNGRSLSINRHKMHLIQVAERLGVRLPASPPPGPQRPDGRRPKNAANKCIKIPPQTRSTEMSMNESEAHPAQRAAGTVAASTQRRPPSRTAPVAPANRDINHQMYGN